MSVRDDGAADEFGHEVDSAHVGGVVGSVDAHEPQSSLVGEGVDYLVSVGALVAAEHVAQELDLTWVRYAGPECGCDRVSLLGSGGDAGDGEFSDFGVHSVYQWLKQEPVHDLFVAKVCRDCVYRYPGCVSDGLRRGEFGALRFENVEGGFSDCVFRVGHFASVCIARPVSGGLTQTDEKQA